MIASYVAASFNSRQYAQRYYCLSVYCLRTNYGDKMVDIHILSMLCRLNKSVFFDDKISVYNDLKLVISTQNKFMQTDFIRLEEIVLNNKRYYIVTH